MSEIFSQVSAARVYYVVLFPEQTETLIIPIVKQVNIDASVTIVTCVLSQCTV